jgi:hypothetical protein
MPFLVIGGCIIIAGLLLWLASRADSKLSAVVVELGKAVAA